MKVELFIDDFINSSADATGKLVDMKSTLGSDRKVYTSVEEFMADRQTLIDLVVERRQNLQVSTNHSEWAMSRFNVLKIVYFCCRRNR